MCGQMYINNYVQNAMSQTQRNEHATGHVINGYFNISFARLYNLLLSQD